MVRLIYTNLLALFDISNCLNICIIINIIIGIVPLFNRCLTVMNSKYYIISLYHIIDIKNICMIISITEVMNCAVI